MDNRSVSLMAIAMAGIAAPVVNATIYFDTPDFSGDLGAPTSLGAFNPTADTIFGSVTNTDFNDAILVTATPGASTTLPVSLYNPPAAFPFVQIQIFDDAGGVGLLANGNYDPIPTNSTLNFTVPADGDYMIYLSSEGAGSAYTLGVAAVPEPSTSLLLAGAVGLAALLRKRNSRS